MDGLMTEKIGEPAVLELMAEECTELAHASLKLARIIRGENPTPKNADAARLEVMEELADVFVTTDYLEELEWFRAGIVGMFMKRKRKRAWERVRYADDQTVGKREDMWTE